MTADEFDDARAYWRSLTTNDFYADDQHWRHFMADQIVALQPRSVLEFGCNVGRNLLEVRARRSDVRVVGVDVNREAVEHGSRKHGLDLRCGNESYLERFAPGEFDAVMTVSVLDHLPAVEDAIRAVLRVAARSVLFLEPYTGEDRRADLPTDAGLTAFTSVPYTYLWDYGRILGSLGAGWDWTYSPYPLSQHNLGPLYWLMVGRRVHRSGVT